MRLSELTNKPVPSSNVPPSNVAPTEKLCFCFSFHALPSLDNNFHTAIIKKQHFAHCHCKETISKLPLLGSKRFQLFIKDGTFFFKLFSFTKCYNINYFGNPFTVRPPSIIVNCCLNSIYRLKCHFTIAPIPYCTWRSIHPNPTYSTTVQNPSEKTFFEGTMVLRTRV